MSELLCKLPEPLINTKTKSGLRLKAYTEDQMLEFANKCVLKKTEEYEDFFDGLQTDTCPGMDISKTIRKLYNDKLTGAL